MDAQTSGYLFGIIVVIAGLGIGWHYTESRWLHVAMLLACLQSAAYASFPRYRDWCMRIAMAWRR